MIGRLPGETLELANPVRFDESKHRRDYKGRFARGDRVSIVIGKGVHRRRAGVVSRQSEDGRTVYVNIGSETKPEIKVRSPEQVKPVTEIPDRVEIGTLEPKTRIQTIRGKHFEISKHGKWTTVYPIDDEGNRTGKHTVLPKDTKVAVLKAQLTRDQKQAAFEEAIPERTVVELPDTKSELKLVNNDTDDYMGGWSIEYDDGTVVAGPYAAEVDARSELERLQKKPESEGVSEIDALQVVYADFAASTGEVANSLGISQAQALQLLRSLEEKQIVVGMESDESGWVRERGDERARAKDKRFIDMTWQSYRTYDDNSWEEVREWATGKGASADPTIKPGSKTPEQKKAETEQKRKLKPATDRQIKVVANAASPSFKPMELLALDDDELDRRLAQARARKGEGRTLGEQSASRALVANLGAIQQIKGDDEAIRKMLDVMYDNEYKRRSPDLMAKDKPVLMQRVGTTDKKAKKGDLVRTLIEREIGTRDQFHVRQRGGPAPVPDDDGLGPRAADRQIQPGATATGRMQQEMDQSTVALRTHTAGLKGILRHGAFKSVHTGEVFTTGLGGDRRPLEEEIWSIPPGSPPEAYPLYGYVAPPDEAGIGGDDDIALANYGHIKLELKPEVKRRTTVTYGDSLMIPDPKPSPMTAVKPETAEDWKPHDSIGVYTEAQIFGGVKADDIQRVVFGIGEPDAETKSLLRERGIPWTVDPDATRNAESWTHENGHDFYMSAKVIGPMPGELHLDTQPTGVMVALYPADPGPLAISGGEKPDQLHVTLAFLGKRWNVDKATLLAAVADWAANTPTITGTISGVGYFLEGEKPVTYWSIDAPRLPEAHGDLVARLLAAALPVKREHGFSPHMTVDYRKRQVAPPTGKTLRFGSAVVAFGGEHHRFPFQGQALALSVVTFDPQKHPRDWEGRFRDALNGLPKGGKLKLPGGRYIERTEPPGMKPRFRTLDAEQNEVGKPTSDIKRIVSRVESDPRVPTPGADGFIDVGDDVKRAADLLGQGKKVKLDQPRRASVLLDELRKRVQEAKDKGENAPDFDLCKVTVRDTNLFCAESKGIPRVQMPQLSGVPTPGSKADELPKDSRGGVDLSQQFREHLEAKGHKVTDRTEKASYLKASQIELNGAKVAGMTKALEDGKLPPGRIFTSADNYIVDGHHRWAANVGADTSDNVLGDVDMDIASIDMDIIELLDESNRFAAEWGIPQASIAKMSQPFNYGRYLLALSQERRSRGL